MTAKSKPLRSNTVQVESSAAQGIVSPYHLNLQSLTYCVNYRV